MNDTSLQAIRHAGENQTSFSSLLGYELNRIISWKGGKKAFVHCYQVVFSFSCPVSLLKAFINSKRHDELYIHTFA